MKVRPLAAEDIEIVRSWKNSSESFVRVQARVRGSSQVAIYTKVAPEAWEKFQPAIINRIAEQLTGKLQNFLNKFTPYIQPEGRR